MWALFWCRPYRRGPEGSELEQKYHQVCICLDRQAPLQREHLDVNKQPNTVEQFLALHDP